MSGATNDREDKSTADSTALHPRSSATLKRTRSGIPKGWTASNAISYLQGESLGRGYDELCRKYVHLENDGRNKTAVLARKLRPPKLKSAASFEEFTGVGTTAQLQLNEEAFWPWWIDMQPAWREVENGRPAPLQKGHSDLHRADWKALHKSGPQGWYLLILYMKWWKMDLDEYGGSDKVVHERKWLDAIQDLTETLDALLGAIRITQK